MSVHLISLPEGIHHLSGLLDIGYYAQVQVGYFGDIKSVKITSEVTPFYGTSGGSFIRDQIAQYESETVKIGYCYSLQVETRDVVVEYLYNSKFYVDEACTNEAPFPRDPTTLYKIINKDSDSNPIYYIFGDYSYTELNTEMRIGINDNPVEIINLGTYEAG
jgi:hypothetical protein